MSSAGTKMARRKYSGLTQKLLRKKVNEQQFNLPNLTLPIFWIAAFIKINNPKSSIRF